jgi:hypothetical protein
MWSLLGPPFPYIWCHDSGWVSPLILVGPRFQLTTWTPWGHDWPGLILPIALLTSNTGHSLVSPHTLLGLPLRSLPSVSLGFKHPPLFGYLWDSDSRGWFPSLCSAWVCFCHWSRRPPICKAWCWVTHKLRARGPYKLLEHSDGCFLCALYRSQDIWATRGCPMTPYSLPTGSHYGDHLLFAIWLPTKMPPQ